MKTNQKVVVVLEFLLAIFALSIKPTQGASGEYMDGWGISMLIAALGVGGIFFLMRERSRQKNITLNVVSMCLALFTVFGQSYMAESSFNPLFTDYMQVTRTFVLWGGVQPNL